MERGHIEASAVCQWTVIRRRGRPHVRHFIMHARRASHGSAPPLNCGLGAILSVAPI